MIGTSPVGSSDFVEAAGRIDIEAYGSEQRAPLVVRDHRPSRTGKDHASAKSLHAKQQDPDGRTDSEKPVRSVKRQPERDSKEILTRLPQAA